MVKPNSDAEHSAAEKKLSPRGVSTNNSNSHYIIQDEDTQPDQLGQDLQRKRTAKALGDYTNDTYASLIDKTERDFNTEKGEISNIEQIYKKVFGKLSVDEQPCR